MKEPLLNSTLKFINSYSSKYRFTPTIICRFCSTESKEDILKYQNELFNAERQRQCKNVARIEKITVQYRGLPTDARLIMNKYISTPFNCAQHMFEMLVRRSALALVDGTKLWDMHRPLEADCELQLLHFQDENPTHANKALWRTCSLMLGAVAMNAFKDRVPVILHSFPKPNVRSGSFVYDVELPTLPNWKPTPDELRIFSAEMVKLGNENLPVERLSVPEDLASKIFEHNKYKLEQIPGMAEQNPDKEVVLYRIGKHIDVSRGPMMANTGLLGRCTIAAVHKLENDCGNFYRFQGVALPKGLLLNHFAFSIIEKKAQKLNQGRLPWQYSEDVYQSEFESVEAVL